MAYSKQTWDTTSYVNPTRMNHIEDGIRSADLTSGGTITGNLFIQKSSGDSNVVLGGNSSRGVSRYYDETGHFVDVYPNTITTNRAITLPNKAGTLVVGQAAHFNCTGVASTSHSSGWHYADYEVTLNKTYGSNAVAIVTHQRGVPFIDQADITGNKLYIRIWSLSSFGASTSFVVNVFLSENESLTN